MDIVASALAIVVLTPVLLAVALLIKTTSRGSVFYVQERVGRDGKPFRMMKFRSMYRDAHERRNEHAELNIHQGPSSRSATTPGSRRSATPSAGSRSTSCHSSSTC